MEERQPGDSEEMTKSGGPGLQSVPCSDRFQILTRISTLSTGTVLVFITQGWKQRGRGVVTPPSATPPKPGTGIM